MLNGGLIAHFSVLDEIRLIPSPLVPVRLLAQLVQLFKFADSVNKL